MSVPIIDIKNLNIVVSEKGKLFNIVEDISFKINESEIVGLVGESGSGKSVAALSITGLLPKAVSIKKGSIKFNDIELQRLNNDSFSDIRGKDISMIFQDTMTSLNPVYPVGEQVCECLKLHSKISKSDVKKAAIDIMTKVGLNGADKLYYSYPHELSGGMRQRIMIAMAIIMNPKLLIADEPTTALDVTIQAQILELIKKINVQYKTAMLFISHDLGVVKNLCHRVLVMYSGQIVEEATSVEIFKNPLHPYTIGLLECVPDRSKKGKPLLPIKGNIPSLTERITNACAFAPRCTRAKEKCFLEKPELLEISDGHSVRCFFWQEERGGSFGK